jgi:AcrR family transcriptional regulator
MAASAGVERGSAPRERLLAAMAAAIERQGFRDTTVADVVAIARTSRRTFYEHFAERQACLLALFQQTTDEMLEQIAAAVDPDARWEEQADQAIDAYIAHVVAHPALHRSFAHELPVAERACLELRRRVMERFAALLMALVERSRERHPERVAPALTRDVAIILVAGLRELLVLALQDGRDPAELRASARQVALAILGGAAQGMPTSAALAGGSES